MLKKSCYLCLSILIASCSFLNEEYVMLPIKSNPPGAQIYIDGQYKGQTPTKIKIIPHKDKDYTATLVKQGYGSANIKLESWYALREKREGWDKLRCSLDAFGVMLVVPAFGFYSVYCRDFKEEEYVANLGQGVFFGNQNAPSAFQGSPVMPQAPVVSTQPGYNSPYESEANPYGNNSAY